ncbi:SpoIIE family protein phosphatase [Streptomyces sp. ISL-96]|uniref:SpoIIE family protein phosphatase n=1 Tax=Streptomyces sp. ISL-96 TaxID=2819191 RepID=UPI001BEC0B50|nr:SpoIIE family protein phosphatase [Streptomyces sp. ISL-96]MBT2489666.1 SpoIIE family protein phosphatase [Streptomyces sp. ISL-96]
MAVGAPVRKFSESPEDPFAVRRAASVVLDNRGGVVGWSERAEQLLGYSAGEVIGRPALEFLVDPGDRPVVSDVAAECTRARGWFGVVPLRHRGGHRVELGIRARVVTRAGSVREWFLVGAPAEEVTRWELDRAVLDGMFRRSPIGLVVLSPDLRVVRVNQAIARVSGLPTGRHVGLRSAELLVSEDAQVAENRLRRVLETGRPAIFTEQSSRLRRDPRRELVVSVSSFRMEDSTGRVIGVTELIEDVTDRHRARRRLALLNEASARIGTTLDVGQTARELADVAVPDFADHVSVDLLEPVPRGEDPPQETAGPVSRMAVRSVSDPEAQLMHPVGELIHLRPEAPQARCLAERRPVLEPAAGISAAWYSMELPRAEGADGLDVHSLIVVPLAARGQVLGVVSLWRSRRPEPFEEDDLMLAQEFASRAAVTIDNARRYTQQQQAALTLQRSLLPRDVPEHPAIEVAYRYLPASAASGLGGDWFDVIPLSGTRVALVVGDVVGHGIHAAATMGRLRTAVHTLASLDLEPDEVLSRLDDLVNLLAAEQEAVSGNLPQTAQVVGATCLYAVYDPISRRCAVACAGHLPPAVATPEGRVTLLDMPVGPPLGLGGLPFEIYELELAEGSLLALYTNGLIETRHGDIDVPLARLRATLSRPAQPLEQTCQAVLDSVLTGHPRDDVALLIARTRVLPPEKVASWELPAEPTAAARARALTRAKLTEWGLGQLTFTTELVASELVTNAYRYAGGPVVLRLIHDGNLICEVSDTSSTSPHLRRARSTDEGGRGLFLVAQFTERWGTRYTRDGKTVWTEQTVG